MKNTQSQAPGRPEINLQTTIVFGKIWAAMHEKTSAGERRYKYIVLKGSSRSSKTFSLIDCLDLYARKEKNKRVTVWRDSKVDCVDTVFNDIEKRLSTTGRWQVGNKFNATKTYLKYDSKSTIEAHGADDAVSIHGLTQDIAWLNEPYKISKDIFDQIDQRTSELILIDWNPRLAHWIEDLAKDAKALVITSTFKDNPFCPEAQRDKILSYQPVKNCFIVENKILPEDRARNYDTVANALKIEPKHLRELQRCQINEYKRSASEYNWSVYGLGERAEKPNRILKWTEISMQEYNAIEAPIYSAVDWGVVDPWAISDVKYYDGALYVNERNYSSENEIRERLNDTERAQLSSEDEGLVTWFFNKLGIPYDREIICDSNRKMKILALRGAGWDYAIGVTKGQGSIIDGVSLLNDLQVFYTDTSVNVKHEQENYSRKVDRYGVVLEEPEDFDNHHIDGIRYVATYLHSQGVIRRK